MGKHRDWTEIRTEYEKDGTSLTDLSKKHGVSLSTLKKAAARQGWKHAAKAKAIKAVQKRATAAAKKMEPNGTAENGTEPKETISKGTAPAMSKEESEQRFDAMVTGLIEKVEQSIEIVQPEAVKALRDLSAVLKDLRMLLKLEKDELDKEEQRARIDKLRAEIETGAPAGPVVIKFVDTEGAEE